MTRTRSPKLSICIPTFNRAAFIREALESIVVQATSECEIVVSDNASTDHTGEVVAEYARRFDRIRYTRQKENVGFDRNCDWAVECAHGEYCWLFSDDDVMKPGAISTVIEALRCNHGLVLVNGEHKDFTLSNVRAPSFFGVEADRVYLPEEFDRLFADMGICSMCLCCVVIKRSLWAARERSRYYGSWFIHTAVIFQEPLPESTLVMAKPLMSLRLGNEQTAQAALFQVWYVCWPELLWSFPVGETTKRRFCEPNPWKNPRYLLALRVRGCYSKAEYRRCLRPRLATFREALTPRLVALLPRTLARGLYVALSLAAGRSTSLHDTYEGMFPTSLRVLRAEPD